MGLISAGCAKARLDWQAAASTVQAGGDDWMVLAGKVVHACHFCGSRSLRVKPHDQDFPKFEATRSTQIQHIVCHQNKKEKNGSNRVDCLAIRARGYLR